MTRPTRSVSTRRALVDAAERLFAEHGYSATALEAIVAGAEVTKGALYHHFSGKQAIFEAAFAQVGSRAAADVGAATDGLHDPWEQAEAGLRAFLAAVQEPAYRQVVVLDGPSVLGPERHREKQERSTYAVVEAIVRPLLTAGDRDLDADVLDVLTRMTFGALTAAGGSATDDDPAVTSRRVEAAIAFVLAGLRRRSVIGATWRT